MCPASIVVAVDHHRPKLLSVGDVGPGVQAPRVVDLPLGFGLGELLIHLVAEILFIALKERTQFGDIREFKLVLRRGDVLILIGQPYSTDQYH